MTFPAIFKTTPRPYQENVLNRVIDSQMNFWMLNADPGLGKTKITIDIACNLHLLKAIGDVWVIAPNNVHRQWVDEQLPIHAATPYTSLIYSAEDWNKKQYQAQLETYKASDRLRFLSINIETFSTESGLERLRELFKCSSKRILLVIDESSRIKNPKGKRSKTIRDLAKGCTFVTCLTGTPVTNSPFDVFNQYDTMKENFFGCNYFVFQHRHGLMVKRRTNGQTFQTLADKRDFSYVHSLAKKAREVNQEPDVQGIAARTNLSESSVRWIMQHPDSLLPYKDLDKLKTTIAPYTFTIRKEDVAKEIPEKIYTSIYAELTPEQRKAYKELTKNYTAEYAGKELTLEIAMTLTLRLQQITGGFFPTGDDDKVIPFAQNPKLDMLLDDLEETDGRSIIIWAVFRAEIEAITEAARKRFPDWRVESYYGGTTQKQKQEIEAAFKAGEVNVFVAHPKSAGIGLNLQVSNLAYIYSNGFSLEDRVQQEDRQHRIGQLHPVTYKDVYIKGTVDDKIQAAFRQRKNVLDFFRGSKNIEDLF